MKNINAFHLVLTFLVFYILISPSIVLAAASKVTFRNDGITLFNSQPFFPLGLFYWFPDDNLNISSDHSGNMQDIKNAGFNTVFLGGNRRDGSFLTQAQNLGLKIVDYNAFFNPEVTDNYLQTVAASPNFLAWYGVDEPEASNLCVVANGICTGFNNDNPVLPTIRSDYSRLWHNNVSGHPLWTIYSPGVTGEYINSWNSLSGTTVSGIDIYAFPAGRWNKPPWCSDTSMRCVGEMTDKIKAVTGPGSPIWMGLQGFKNLPAEGVVNNPYPTLEQSRFMAYEAIVHGATGIFWWDYGLKTTDVTAPDDLWRSLKLMATELTDAAIMPALLGMNRQVSRSGPVKILSTDDVSGTYKYKIAVNETTQPAGNYVISGFSPNSDIFVFVENRWLKADNSGNINDRFDDWSVHLYRQEIQNALILPGDLNHDDRVDILDLRQLLGNFTSIFDYNLVVGNFGK